MFVMLQACINTCESRSIQTTNAESNLLTGIGYICHNSVLDAMYLTGTISVLGISIATQVGGWYTYQNGIVYDTAIERLYLKLHFEDDNWCNLVNS